MSFVVDLSTILNLTAVTLGGLAVYKMLTMTLGKPSSSPPHPLMTTDKFFVDEGDNGNFEEIWKTMIESKDSRQKLKGKHLEFLKLSGIGENTWGVRFGDLFPMYFRIDGETKSMLIANADLYGYSYTTH